ncbi:MAG TPA: sensor histidine kinase [Kineosporiaceae bacterium]|nr:sensor histidine kinase [Kineosporiaceae bacterium]
MAVTTTRTWPGRRGIRVRILAIAWIPSLLLLAGGIAVSAVLAYQGTQIARFTDRFNADTPGVLTFSQALMTERRASVVYLADPTHNRAAVDAARRDLDAIAGPVLAATQQRAATDPEVYSQLVTDGTRSLKELPAIRQRIDAQQAGLLEVEDFYSEALDAVATSLHLIAGAEPVPQAAVSLAGIVSLFKANSIYLQADELALAASMGPGLSQAEFSRYAQALGGQRALLDEARVSLDTAGAVRLDQLRKSPAWQRLEAVHNTILLRGPSRGGPTQAAPGPAADASGAMTVPDRTTRQTRSGRQAAASGVPSAGATVAAEGATGTLPNPAAWNADMVTALQGLGGIGTGAAQRATALSRDAGQSQLEQAATVGAVLLVIGVLVLLVTTWTSGRLIGRLRRLREETLLLSRQRLPGIVTRLRQGEQVDVAAEVSPLDLGDDEIGQVAHAFNQAQETAIAAAVGEAEARAGLRTVFINIAHRSQSIVHRQLNLLDQAERSQEDPDQLALLFELDHLTTRARRNAENLILLGGGQAGRQWRNPVPLVQVVRGAISEARDYVRVSLGVLPQVNVVGGAVADIVHLLAELVDNATTFSPPTSRVEVRGNAAGRGIVLEVEDQGLGIEPEQLEHLNKLLHQPPDFQAMALADEPRLGIFVVAQLAARQGIRVTLTPSPAYGGTRAVILIPSDIVATIDLDSPSAAETTTVEPVSLAPGRIAEYAPSGAVVPGVAPPDASLPHRQAPWHADPAVIPSADAQPQALTSGGARDSHPGEEPYGGSEPADEDRPPLPRRARQTHLVPHLRTPSTADLSPDAQPPAELDPEVARQRLGAFQRGTRRARADEQPPEG